MLLRCVRRFRSGLPTLNELSAAIAAGLMLSLLVGIATGCSGFSRWPALLDVVSNLEATERREPASKPPMETALGTIVTESHAAAVSTTTTATAASNTAALSSDMSITLRLDMWIASLEAVRQAPLFGHGALSLRPIIEDRFHFEYNHNQYLAWLVTGGVVFLVIGLLFLSTPVLVSNGLSPVDRVVIILSVTGALGHRHDIRRLPAPRFLSPLLQSAAGLPFRAYQRYGQGADIEERVCVMPQNTIFFDLTEALLSASARRVQYYGIARTVIEAGKEAAALDGDIRFVVFSFGNQAFYEVKWQRAPDGGIVLDLPKDVGQRWYRTYYGGSAFLSGIARLLGIRVAGRNRNA